MDFNSEGKKGSFDVITEYTVCGLIVNCLNRKPRRCDGQSDGGSEDWLRLQP